MNKWIDPFTGMGYRFSEGWASNVRQHLAELLNGQLHGLKDARQAANRCAEFWQRYYGLVFPLKFGREAGNNAFKGQPLFDEAAEREIDLDQYSGRGLRDLEYVHGQWLPSLKDNKLPPLLTPENTPSVSSSILIADHHLVCAALCNILLQAQGQGETDLLQQVRLGVLAHELIDGVNLEAFPEAAQIASFLKHGTGDLPAGVDGEWLKALHEERPLEGGEISLVGIGAQRIKQFVFESSGLNEIRGASTLLDDCVVRLKQEVSKELGPEVILRAAAGTFEFLAPSGAGKAWLERLRAQFFSLAGTASVAAATIKTTPTELLINYQDTLLKFQTAIECDRYQPELPLTETLPFEMRCALCGQRAAEDWQTNLEGPATPICRVCITKRDLGKKERKGKVGDVLDWLGLDDPRPLGVNRIDYVAQKLDELVPPEAKRKKLAVIYGDGNNFGEVVGKLSSLALGLQWTHRVERVTQTALALALARATQEVASARTSLLPKLPFQILSLGGDDLSVLTWGRIGLRVCEQFLHLTGLEFEQGDNPPLTKKRLAFSLGALFCDDKAPVRRTVDFAKNELLKWAKRAARYQAQEHGNLAFQLALMAEQIPANLKAYRKQMFLPSNSEQTFCLTMRPFTADELSFLLEKAGALKDARQQGLLQNLVAAFMQSHYRVALLHYYYQKARDTKGFFDKLDPMKWKELFGDFPLVGIKDGEPRNFFFKRQIAQPLVRSPFGEEQDQKPDQRGSKVALLPPLWDLYEIIKILE